MTKIFWAGDSTVKQNTILTYPQTGIGQGLPLFLQRGVMIENHAENGRSTKSFIDELRLDQIDRQIKKNDFLFIQFGHNDQKRQDPLRFTEAFGEFQINLKKFIQVAVNKEAYPVLITPVERRLFTADGQLQVSEHDPYTKAMKQLANESQIPLIDLHQQSRQAIQKAGSDDSRAWFMHLASESYPAYPDGLTDNTHLQYGGAVVFASFIAAGLKQLGGVYQQLLIDGF